jgi:hypothetical protein
MLRRLGGGVLVATLLATPAALLAHGGGLDRYGCHRETRTGTYHCHRGPCAGKTFGSQAEMLADACSKTPPPKPPQG